MTGKEHPSLWDTTLNPDPSPRIGRRESELQEMFWREVRACEGKVLPGPGQVLRWGVPDGRKEAQTGEVLHDDLLVSAALCVVLDNEPVGLAVSVVIPPRDIFEGMPPAY